MKAFFGLFAAASGVKVNLKDDKHKGADLFAA
jgi:hypothetical protein